MVHIKFKCSVAMIGKRNEIKEKKCVQCVFVARIGDDSMFTEKFGEKVRHLFNKCINTIAGTTKQTAKI